MGGSYSVGISLGDVDGDGDLDAFIANVQDQANKVWLNDGSGTFTDSGQSLGGSWSYDIALGDMDGDGDLDAFVVNCVDQANKVWLNDGSGTFTDSGQSLGGSWSVGIALGDLDGDGDLDAFVANESQAHRVWKNTDATNPTVTISNIPDFVHLLTEISGTSADTPPGELDKVQVQIKNTTDNNYWNGSAWQVGATWLDASGTISWTYTMPILEDASYAIQAKSIDGAGNISAQASESFVCDGTTPTTPVNIAKTTPDSDNTPTFTWNACTDATSGVASYEVRMGLGDFTEISNVTTFTVATALPRMATMPSTSEQRTMLATQGQQPA